MARRQLLVNVSNVLVIGLALVWAFHRDGPVRKVWTARAEAKATAETISMNWDGLTSRGGRLGAGDVATAVMFVDYQCPGCRTQDSALTAILRTQADVSVLVRHFPITGIHPHAENAARFAICAENIGQFEQAHTALFRTLSSGDVPVPDWEVLEAEISNEPKEIVKCMTEHATTARLRQDSAVAARLSIRGTPTLVTRKTIHSGLATVEELSALLAR